MVLNLPEPSTNFSSAVKKSRYLNINKIQFVKLVRTLINYPKAEKKFPTVLKKKLIPAFVVKRH